MPSSVSSFSDTRGILIMGIVVGLLLVFYFSPSYANKLISSGAGPYDLSVKNTIIQESLSNAFYADSNGTFSAFIYLNPINRSGTHSPCGVNNNQPSCEDGTFAPCPCHTTTSDCSVCDHAGYKSVFNISGIVGLEVLVAPDASRQGQAVTQLLVKTQGPPLTSGSSRVRSGSDSGPAIASQKYIETLALPAMPFQKWTYVTVSREGRRFDVYFNNTLVLSKKTMSMPIANMSNSSMGGIISGSEGLAGQLAVANLYNYRMTSKEVSANYSKYADTRGRPYLNSVTNPLGLADSAGVTPSYAPTFSTALSSYLPSMSICPSGGCFNPPVVKAATPLYDWSTSYQ